MFLFFYIILLHLVYLELEDNVNSNYVNSSTQNTEYQIKWATKLETSRILTSPKDLNQKFNQVETNNETHDLDKRLDFTTKKENISNFSNDSEQLVFAKRSFSKRPLHDDKEVDIDYPSSSQQTPTIDTTMSHDEGIIDNEDEDIINDNNVVFGSNDIKVDGEFDTSAITSSSLVTESLVSDKFRIFSKEVF